MSRFVLAPLAKQDLQDINAYIAKDSTSAARRVIRELRAKMSQLAESPGLGHKHEFIPQEDPRVVVVYSYLIVFCPERRPIEIARVIYGGMDLEQVFAQE
ncbi:MAG: type II toxin-antitoxin system RelE/ParE family toxin [Planctomycetota bacterium]